LADHIVHHQHGLRHPARLAFAEARNREVHLLHEAVDALQPVLVIRHRLERRDPLARAEIGKGGVKAEEVIDRPHNRCRYDRGPQAFERIKRLIFEHVVAHPVCAR
jgi:hypothetical protein